MEEVGYVWTDRHSAYHTTELCDTFFSDYWFATGAQSHLVPGTTGSGKVCLTIKEAKSIGCAKKAIKTFCKTIPI